MSLTSIAAIFAGRRIAEDHVTFETTDDWTQGRALFGGLVAAMMLRGGRDLLSVSRPLRSAQITFAGPVPFGPVDVTARMLRSGRSATLMSAEIAGADGSVLAMMVAAFGDSRASAVSHPVPTVLPAKNRADVTPVPSGLKLLPAFTQHVEMRWAQGSIPYSGSTDHRTQIFLDWRTELPDAETALIAYSDAIPSPAISMLPQFAPVSSLTWSLELPGDTLTLPFEGGMRMDAHMDSVTDGYGNHHALLYDNDGRLRSISRQVVALFG